MRPEKAWSSASGKVFKSSRTRNTNCKLCLNPCSLTLWLVKESTQFERLANGVPGVMVYLVLPRGLFLKSPEKRSVKKLRSAYYEKWIFEHIFKNLGNETIAKFHDLKPRRFSFEDTQRFTSTEIRPKSFVAGFAWFRKGLGWHLTLNNPVVILADSTHSFIHSFIHLFIHSFIHSFLDSPILSAVHSFIHFFVDVQ